MIVRWKTYPPICLSQYGINHRLIWRYGDQMKIYNNIYGEDGVRSGALVIGLFPFGISQIQWPFQEPIY